MSNIEDALKPEYPFDVKVLKERFRILRNYTDTEVSVMYHRFSGDWYAAEWMILSEETLSMFGTWLDS